MIDSVSQKAIVPKTSHGKRADVVLAELFPQYSRSLLSNWLKAGFITFNEQSLKPKDKVVGEEQVLLKVPIEQNTVVDRPQDIPLNIVFEDEHVLVINKPADFVVHPGAGNAEHTLVNALLYHDESLQQLPRAGIVHRLDKDTTGLLIIAKTLPAYTALVRQMQAREIKRHYQAVVMGHVVAGGRIETFFGRHPKNRLKMAVTKQGKEAITEYMVKKHYSHFTLLDIQLMTGRTHQIRVHMAHIKHPIVGDPLYGGRLRLPAGGSEKLKEALLRFNRQALHAYSLSFSHPISGQTLTLTAPLPDDLIELLTVLEDEDSIC